MHLKYAEDDTVYVNVDKTDTVRFNKKFKPIKKFLSKRIQPTISIKLLKNPIKNNYSNNIKFISIKFNFILQSYLTGVRSNMLSANIYLYVVIVYIFSNI